MAQILETYLRELRDIRLSGAGVKETSYYGPLANLLNEVGQGLKPKVRCIINLRNQGEGIPDGGLFTPDQFQKASEANPLPGQAPARGAIEVKSTSEDVTDIARSAQVRKYLQRYRQVLVTNYRDFVLVTPGPGVEPQMLEAYSLADSEADFWRAAAHPRALATWHGERFVEYLKRVMLHAAQLSSPQDVAWFLASYARDAKSRLEVRDVESLASLRAALEDALGLKFEGEKGEHFFRSTLVQTLFYGIFSAWVLWRKELPAGSTARFDWHTAAWSLHVPIIRTLFEQIATRGTLQPLDLVEVLDWAGAALNRIDPNAFFAAFDEGQAVQYFYEPFLQAFDPELRKELGVWYTPPQIVKYMVARVDTVLREELGLADGLADPQVYILDPCCGTGAYLVEVLQRIAATLRAKGEGAMVGHRTKQAAKERVFGFEILPAPFVVAHLQLGLLLQNLGAPLQHDTDERAGVYLTNALTGWEPPEGPKTQLSLSALEAEREAADRVKHRDTILVVLGNPPYNGFAGVSPAEERGLIEPYKTGLSDWGITKNYLDDLYVRFFRVAERRIAEYTGKGIVCFISNHSWISDPTYVVLRQHLLQSFDRFWVENMHGDRKISEYAPDGRTSETIFAIQGTSVGIQQGVAVSLWLKGGRSADKPQVLFRDDLNAARATERRAQLLASLNHGDFNSLYEPANPSAANRYVFRPLSSAPGYGGWPTLKDISEVEPLLGLNDNRKQAVHDISYDSIAERMRAYYDAAVPFADVGRLHAGLVTDAAGFDARATRERLIKQTGFSKDNICRFWFKPFDIRWAYTEKVANLWNRVRPDLLEEAWSGNLFILTRCHAAKAPDGAALFASRHIADQHVLHSDAYFMPIWTRRALSPGDKGPQGALPLPDERPRRANLSSSARAYLLSLRCSAPDADERIAALVWMHALAVGYSPAYLTENADGIRQDWPRIPLPATHDRLLASAELGQQIAALLDTETPVAGVTCGTIRLELAAIGAVSRVGGGSLNPDTGDLRVTAGWGHAGKGGVTMPARGKAVERAYHSDELAAIPENARAQLGEKTCDLYLNDVAYWRNVPTRVYAYTIGGYQVIKKWLSYREEPLLGRPLRAEEADEVRDMARRIAAILLLEPELDANYDAVKANTANWADFTPPAA